MNVNRRVFRPRQPQVTNNAVDKDGFINNFNRTIDKIELVSEENMFSRLLIACDFLKFVLNTDKYLFHAQQCILFLKKSHHILFIITSATSIAGFLLTSIFNRFII